MDKKRKVFVIGLVALMVVFTVVNFIISRNYTRGINSTKETETNVSQSSVSSKQSLSSSSSEEKTILSFDEYQKFYEYMAENLRLKGYEKKYETGHNFLLYIRKEWTFNSRDSLITKNSDTVPDPTFEYIIYENKESTSQIRLGISFNEYYIGDNLHSFYAKDNDLSKINKKLAGQAVGAVTSYRNLLFHVQVSQEDEAKNVLDDTLTAISKEIIKYFN